MTRTVLVIETDEPVTPAYIAQRVAEACASYGALRPGESVVLPRMQPLDDEVRFVITDTPRPPLFGALDKDGEPR
jgi:hypothetical protein